MDNLEGRTLGKYDLTRILGRGNMGTVYLAQDPFTGRDVAVKVAHPPALGAEGGASRYRKLFFNEAKVAGRLRHANIVSVYDAGIEGDIWYLVMEYVPGAQTLAEHCAPECLLPVEEVVRIAFNCARALDFAHRQGVVHRDVKPRNILLTGDREVKVADFGVALLTYLDATDTQVEGVIGSPLYMSPEQLREEGVSNQSDLFSLGVVLYELLCGRHPFAAENLATVIYNVTERRHEPVRALRAEVPRVLGHIVDRCLKKRTADRYRTCLDLAADLSLVFDEMKIEPLELSARERFRRVQGLSFFRSFSEPEVWELIHASAWQQCEPGESIIREGELDTSFYVIVEGEVVVRKREVDLDVLAAGDCFGEMGFVAGRERTATILAKTRVAVIKVTASLIARASLRCQLRFKDVFLETMVRRLSQADAMIAERLG